MDQPAPDSLAAEPPRHQVLYDGRGGAVGSLALRNILLTLITLGIYRFWAKTRMRRYFWSHVHFMGEAFEYTGTGRELFFGFLIVLAFFLVLGGIYTVLPLLVLTDDPYGPLELKGAALLIFAFLYNYAVWRARRYRLSRSQWRGIRGALTGSGWRYAAIAFGFYFLRVLSLGLLFPWTRLRLHKILMNDSWFGDRRFSFDGDARKLLGHWLLACIPILIFAAVALFIGLFYLPFVMAGVKPPPPPQDIQNIIAFLPILLTVGIPLTVILYIRYRVREFRYFMACTAYEGLRFESGLRTGPVLGRYILFGVLIGVAYFIISTVILFGMLGFVGFSTNAHPNPVAIYGPTVVLIVLILPVLSILRYVIIVHGLAGRICNSLAVIGTADFDAIAQSAQAMPARGEGLAEMLDIGAI